ncbi:restriction endonuclease subunit S [Halomonas korlensis]|uniref:Type I restriction enzyme, S subunit n=1 Tax=Halomonas korlensis TaxID=463301 RepID=A0A1I7G0Z2_9GAMM|nr:restriction endonuclease subunit S [Halomonas korlensis]SFU42124.1 type I restriction enzyme, S subunit [Halomonas korlensis]
MSERVLPEEWVEVSVGEIAEVVSGGTPKAGEPDNFKEAGKGVPWLTPADLSGYGKKGIAHGARDLSEKGYASCSAKLMPAGSVLFSSRAPIGYVAVAENEICTNQGFKSFVFRVRVDSSFAYYYLRSIRGLAESLGTGTTFKEVSGAKIKSLPFVLPPYEEQRLIADKLDELLAQVNNLKARLDAIPAILKRFRQSVLAAAVSGRLTEEWRDEHGSCLGNWELLTIGDVSTVATGKTPSRKEPKYWKDGDVPWLTSASTGVIYTDAPEQFVTQFAVDDCSLKVFEPGTLLLAMYGEGKTRGQVTELRLSATCNQACAAVIADDAKILRGYIKLRLLENYEETRKSAAGGAQPNLNLNKVRAISINVPPKSEQAEIINRVDQLFAFADQIEQQVANAQVRIDKLTQSILAKAFRGELTAEWRSANPQQVSGSSSAESLLKRIKEGREVLVKQSKNRNVSKSCKEDRSMSNKTIKVVEALREAGKPLSGQDLLAAAGYPSDASAEKLEQFFLDIRESLSAQEIVMTRRDEKGQDWFSLTE